MEVQETVQSPSQTSSARVRIGVTLWIISYIPIAIPISDKLHANGTLKTSKSVTVFIAVTWGIQIAIGLIGLYIAGKEVIGMMKQKGLKGLPKNIFRVLIGKPIS